MSYQNPQRYALPVQALHWLVALAIVAVWAIAMVADDLPKEERALWIWTHKSLGVTIFALLLVRIPLRLAFPSPRLPEGTSKLLVGLAHLGHTALYLLMLAVPLVGIAMSWSNGRAVDLWGLPLPALLPEDKPFAHDLKEWHETLGNALLFVAFAHAAAALFHQHWLKDGLLARMLPWGGRSTQQG